MSVSIISSNRHKLVTILRYFTWWNYLIKSLNILDENIKMFSLKL